MLKTTIQLISLSWLITCLACFQRKPAKKYTVGFSQCCKDDWRTIMEKEMLRELDFYPEVEFIIKVADVDSKRQIQQIKDLVNEGVDILIVAPNESAPLTQVIEEVYNKGIPIILVDRETDSEQYTTYIGASNYEIGKTACHYIANKMNGKGKIIEVQMSMSISPAQDRSNGFRDALKNYPEMEIVAELDGGWRNDKVDSLLPPLLEQHPDANIIFGQADDLAAKAYKIIRDKGNVNQFFFLGVDGLAGKHGGIQMVEDGILDASLLYPTGGTESIRSAMAILNNLPIEKRNLLNSTVIDASNARIINFQTEKVMSLQEGISQQKKLTEELQSIYKNQQIFIIILIGSLLLTIVLGGSFWRSLQLKKEANDKLQLKNEEVLRQQQQLVQMSDEVKAATQAKVDFFTNISHEFKTPLTLIMGFADDLLPSPKLNRDIQQGIFLIKENATRLLRLVTQLMDFRKMESERMNVKASENDLISFINSILSSYHRVAKKRNIDLKLISRYEELAVWFDVNMLDKVLFNLLSNAFKFTPNDSEIIVSISKDNLENTVKIKVEDKGKGMKPETVAHIFEAFYQGEGSKQSGTGLGLPLSKKLVQLHNGDISVQSIPEKGSRFTITLPLGKKHFDKIQLLDGQTTQFVVAPIAMPIDLMENNLPHQASPDKEHTLLIIEDNTDIQFFLQKKLNSTYGITEALDGITGLSLAFEQTPDLIICDVKLPEENGLEITKKLKSDLRTSHIPVLMLTSQSSLEQQIAGTKAGADAYMTKPFNVQYLKEKIKNLLYNRQLIKDSYGKELIVLADKAAPNPLDQQFLNQFFEFIEANYNRQDFQVADLSQELSLSRSQLYRKTKALLGMSVSDYIQNIRLSKAEELLKKNELSISEIAYSVGYTSPEYFSTVFKNRYGVSPSNFEKG